MPRPGSNTDRDYPAPPCASAADRAGCRRAAGDRAARCPFPDRRPDSAPKPAGDRGMGIALLDRRQPADSLPYLLRWRKAEPDNPDPYYYLGEAFTDLKVKTIQRLKAANPNSYRLHQILADNYVSIHRKADAIAEYRKTLEIQPGVSGVRYELARLVADTQLEEAIPLLKRELEMDPAHYLASTLLGRVYV